jgi:glycopeptide antibiotics resistance protein
MPGEKIPKVDAPLADKWVHFALFGFLSVLQLLGARTHSPRILRNVLLFGLAYGIAIEGLQGITHQWLHRYFDTTDMIADGLGTVLGIGLFLLLFRRNTTAS